MEKVYKILYLEQSMYLYEVYSKMFESMGYFVQHVIDEHRVMDIYRTQPWDLVLINYDSILQTNQCNFVKVIRKQGDRTPVIAMSSTDCCSILYQGIDDYFVIGCDMNVIKARINKALERHVKQFPQIKSNKFFLSTNTSFDKYVRLLFIRDKTIKLKTMENQLLWLFCLNINRLIYTKDICESIWGVHNKVKEASLMRYIHFLRKLLIEDESISILNEFGKGYKLVNSDLTDGECV